MDFTRRVELDTSYDDAIGRVKDALKDQGFGILTEIDVRQTLKDKLGIDVEPQIILGACNPQLAHRALEIDPRIATLLPCNVVAGTGLLRGRQPDHHRVPLLNHSGRALLNGRR